MSVTTIQKLWTNRITDLDLDATVEVLDTNAAVVFAMEVDNSENTIDSYVKMYNDATVTLGTDAPAEGYRVPASDSITVIFEDDGSGFSFGTAFSVAAVTTGGHAGTTSPANSVIATFLKD